ncbi:hypothetical protein E2320_017186, partial [Naja naja]
LQAKRYLFSSLPLWMKYVAEDKQQIFTEVFMVQHFETKKQSENQDLCWNILQGLSQAMKSLAQLSTAGVVLQGC